MFLLREGVVIKHYIDDTLFFAYPNVCCRMEIYYYCPATDIRIGKKEGVVNIMFYDDTFSQQEHVP